MSSQGSSSQRSRGNSLAKARPADFWQKPFVDIFKHVQLLDWKRAEKVGDVTEKIDHRIGKNTLRVMGSVSATNYIRIPTRTQPSLGLTGHYCYMQIRALPPRYFVIYVDLIGADSHVYRFSLSNMFKEVKISETSILCPLYLNPKWGVIQLDLSAYMRIYTKTDFSQVRSFQFCANLMVRALFTSDINYMNQKLPRDFHLPIKQGKKWNELYEWILLPTAEEEEMAKLRRRREDESHRLRREAELDDGRDIQIDSAAHAQFEEPPEKPSRTARAITRPRRKLAKPTLAPKKKKHPALTVNPILTLSHSIGYSPLTPNNICWSQDDTSIFYPLENCIVRMDIVSRAQSFWAGHTTPITCLAVTPDLLISGAGDTLRLTDLATSELVSMKIVEGTHFYHLSLSASGNLLCALGKDPRGRFKVCIFDISHAPDENMMKTLATHISDYDTRAMKFSPLEENRLVSCGRENIRFWRIKNGQLKGGALALERQIQNNPGLHFTDLSFEKNMDPFGRREHIAYVSTRVGTVFQIDCDSLALVQMYDLNEEDDDPDSAIDPLTSISVNAGVCVTGSISGLSKVWLLHCQEQKQKQPFEDHALEASHTSPISALALAHSGQKAVIGCKGGSIGILDIAGRTHVTIMRSHLGTITAMAFTPPTQLATASVDGAIKIWDTDASVQTYQFDSHHDQPTALAFPPLHPGKLACGFSSGYVRMFDIEHTSLVSSLHQHMDSSVRRLLFHPDKDIFFSFAADDCVVGYSATSNENLYTPYNMINTNGNVIALSQKGNVFVYADANGHICGIDPLTFQPLFRIEQTEPNARVVSLIFANNDTELVLLLSTNVVQRYSLGENYESRLFQEISDPEATKKHFVPSSSAAMLVQSPNNQFFASINQDISVLKIWDSYFRQTPYYQKFLVFTSPPNPSASADIFFNLRFTPDGKEIILSKNNALFIYDFLGETSLDFHPFISKKCEDTPEGLMNKPTLEVPINVEETVTTTETSPKHLPPKHLSSKYKKLGDLSTTLKAIPAKTLPKCHFQSTSHQKAKYKKGMDAKAPAASPCCHLRLHSVMLSHHPSVLWSSKHHLLIYGCGKLLILESLKTKQQVILKTGHYSCFALDPSHNYLALGSASAFKLKLYNLTTHQLETVLLDSKAPAGPLQALSFSPSGRFLAAIGNKQSRIVSLFDLQFRNRTKPIFSFHSPHVLHALTFVDEKIQKSKKLKFAVCGQEMIHLYKLSQDESRTFYTRKLFDLKVRTTKKFGDTQFTNIFSLQKELLLLVLDTRGRLSVWDEKDGSLLSVHELLPQPSELNLLHVDATNHTFIVGGPDCVTVSKYKYSYSDDTRIFSFSLLKACKLPDPPTSFSWDIQAELGVIATTSGAIVNTDFSSLLPLTLPTPGCCHGISFSQHHLFDDEDVNDPDRILLALSPCEKGLLAFHFDSGNNEQPSLFSESEIASSICFEPQKEFARALIGDEKGMLKVWKINETESPQTSLGTVDKTKTFRICDTPCRVLFVKYLLNGSNVIVATSLGDLLIFHNFINELVKPRNDPIAKISLSSNSIIHCVEVSKFIPGCFLACFLDGSNLTHQLGLWDCAGQFLERKRRPRFVDRVSFGTQHNNASSLSFAKFSHSERNIIIHAGGPLAKISIYNFIKKQTIRSFSLLFPLFSFDINPNGTVLAFGAPEGIVRLMCYDDGTYSDYRFHNDTVKFLAFTPKGLISGAENGELYKWLFS